MTMIRILLHTEKKRQKPLEMNPGASVVSGVLLWGNLAIPSLHSIAIDSNVQHYKGDNKKHNKDERRYHTHEKQERAHSIIPSRAFWYYHEQQSRLTSPYFLYHCKAYNPHTVPFCQLLHLLGKESHLQVKNPSPLLSIVQRV